MEDNEKLLEVAVSATGKTQHVPMTIVEEDGVEKKINVKHGLYAFQAVMAVEAPEGEPIPGVVPEDAHKTGLVLPGQPSRDDRRAAQKGKKK